MKKDNKEIKENNLIRIIKGSIASIVIALIMLLVFSIILSFTSVSEQVIPVGIIVISAVSTFLGSMFCNIKISKNGLLNGALVGLIYMVVMYLISSILVAGFGMNIKTIIMCISTIFAGIVGGIVGVNKK